MGSRCDQLHSWCRLCCSGRLRYTACKRQSWMPIQAWMILLLGTGILPWGFIYARHMLSHWDVFLGLNEFSGCHQSTLHLCAFQIWYHMRVRQKDGSVREHSMWWRYLCGTNQACGEGSWITGGVMSSDRVMCISSHIFGKGLGNRWIKAFYEDLRYPHVLINILCAPRTAGRPFAWITELCRKTKLCYYSVHQQNMGSSQWWMNIN